jgi:DNA-binding MarR family transcriptional regulator
MRLQSQKLAELRAFRNSRLYRSLARTLRVYNRVLVDELQALGFADFSPAFPALLSNLDTEGTRVGVLAKRAGVTRQAAGQLLKEIERCGYIERKGSPHDARATVVYFTARGRKLLATVLDLVDTIEADFAEGLKAGEFDRLREGLLKIADRIDPDGALGAADEAAPRKKVVRATWTPASLGRARRKKSAGAQVTA